MNRIRRTILLILLIFFAVFEAKAHAPEPETTTVPWFTPEILFNPFINKNILDTAITGFQRYDLFEKLQSPFYAGKGNVGHVSRALFFNPEMHSGFVLFADDKYSGYLLDFKTQRFYRPEFVFTDIYFVTGSENRQLFYAKHNQRFGEKVYGGLKYQTVNSPGAYSRLASRNAAIALWADVQLGDNYGVLGSFALNRIINKESGGLINHLNFEEDAARDSVFLYRAESRYRDVGFNVHQYYHLDFGRGNDTLSGLKLGVVRHQFYYKRTAFLFDEDVPPTPVFYDHNPLNPQFTFDSTLVYEIGNKIAWSNRMHNSGQGRAAPLFVELSMSHKLVRIQQPLYNGDLTPEDYRFYKNRFAQMGYGMRLASDPGRFLSFDGSANFIAGGYNSGDFDFGGVMRFRPGPGSVRLVFTGHYAEKESPWFMHHFRGNYISWFNDFDKSRTLRMGVGFLSDFLNLEGNYYLMNRAFFMDADALPAQNEGSFPLFTAAASANINFSLFRSRHKLIFQHTNETAFERFPDFASFHSLFADFKLFDDALHLNTGIDIRYNAPYTPMAYMPVVRQFYIRDDFKAGHDLIVDVFVTARISRARFFIKFEHFLGMLADQPPVYQIPFYPVPETTFVFGISWMFFD